MKIYSDGSKGNKIGDEIIWLLAKIVIRDQFGRTYNFQRLKGRNADGISKWSNLSKFLLSEKIYGNRSKVYVKVLNVNNLCG